MNSQKYHSSPNQEKIVFDNYTRAEKSNNSKNGVPFIYATREDERNAMRLLKSKGNAFLLWRYFLDNISWSDEKNVYWLGPQAIENDIGLTGNMYDTAKKALISHGFLTWEGGKWHFHPAPKTPQPKPKEPTKQSESKQIEQPEPVQTEEPQQESQPEPIQQEPEPQPEPVPQPEPKPQPEPQTAPEQPEPVSQEPERQPEPEQVMDNNEKREILDDILDEVSLEFHGNRFTLWTELPRGKVIEAVKARGLPLDGYVMREIDRDYRIKQDGLLFYESGKEHISPARTSKPFWEDEKIRTSGLPF